MDKLYVIRWFLPNGYQISTSSFRSETALKEKMDRNPEWGFELVSDDEAQQIWNAR